MWSQSPQIGVLKVHNLPKFEILMPIMVFSNTGENNDSQTKEAKGALSYVSSLLTLGACARGTVVSLCVCVCVCMCMCVYLSVTTLTAAYIILKSKVRYHRGLHGVLNICNVWLSLKTLCSKVMASFTYHGCLPHSLTSSRRT